jgi:tetratricopeptide (TPR) repeat protein
VLLDRRKVKFWQKIVFSFMAFLLAASLVVFTVGADGCAWFNSDQEDAAQVLDQQIARYKEATTTAPDDPAGWVSLAEAYLSRSATREPGSQDLTADLTDASLAYAKADRLLAKEKGRSARRQRLDVLTSLAGVYSQLGDSERAVQAYGDITTITPKDADAFFNLGAAASAGGDITTAMMAFTRFLELDPTSPYAAEVKDWIASNSSQGEATPTPAATSD